MSNIIKAEYVFFDNSSIDEENYIKTRQTPEVINDSREDLYETYNQREIILKEANDEALKIINAAKRKAQTDIVDCKKRAFEEGYNAGMEIGKNKGYAEGYELGKVKVVEELKSQNENKLKEISVMLAKIEKLKDDLFSKYEKGLRKLAVDIAEKVIRQKYDESDNVISGILKNAIKDYRNSEWIKIYISSKDEVISVQADKLLISELKKISKNVKFEVSEELEQGSAIVETPDGIVDASINTQLNNLKEMVLRKNAV